jgi:hypothetical protein
MPKEKTSVTCPHCEGKLSGEEIRSMWGQYTSAKVVNHVAGPGRPRSAKRCPCGAMTRERAQKRKHVCSPPSRVK